MIRKISGAGCPAIKISTTVGKKMILPFTAMIMTAVVLGGCKRRPLSQVDNNVIVNIEIEKEIAPAMNQVSIGVCATKEAVNNGSK